MLPVTPHQEKSSLYVEWHQALDNSTSLRVLLGDRDSWVSNFFRHPLCRYLLVVYNTNNKAPHYTPVQCVPSYYTPSSVSHPSSQPSKQKQLSTVKMPAASCHIAAKAAVALRLSDLARRRESEYSTSLSSSSISAILIQQEESPPDIQAHPRV
ncbi:uncharacterized protein BKA78DRAFT_112110 [Phyllosticta capitalensis]|uniref:uncharacterized protein n=1 Tax=Phyllosticta capitalensis TaxID=121624 RepID=UPI00312E8A5E